MFNFFKILILILFCNTFSSAQEVSDFYFTDTNGQAHSLYETLDNGTVVVLNFFFSDCPPCLGSDLELEAIRQDYEGTNVEIWSISPHDPDSLIVDYYEEYDLNMISAGIDGGANEVSEIFVDSFDLLYFPTISIICPDRSIFWDVWPYSIGAPEWRGAIEECGVYGVSATRTNEISIINNIDLFPNPTFDLTNLMYSLTESSELKIELLNFSGKKIKQIFSGFKNAGLHEDQISLYNIPKGIYFIQMTFESGDLVTKKIIVE